MSDSKPSLNSPAKLPDDELELPFEEELELEDDELLLELEELLEELLLEELLLELEEPLLSQTGIWKNSVLE